MVLQSLLLAAEDAGASDTSDGLTLGAKFGIVLASFIAAFVIGKFIAQGLRMPDYAGRIGTVLASLSVAGCIVVFNNFMPPLGVDLDGGVILIWQVKQTDETQAAPTTTDAASEGDEAADEEAASDERARIDMPQLVQAITRRINPAGLSEIVVRPYGGDQIEIIVPRAGDDEIERIKGLIRKAGVLEFMIVANDGKDADLIDAAEEQGKLENQRDRKRQTVALDDGRGVTGFWARVRRFPEASDGIRRLRAKSVLGNATLRDAKTGQLVSFDDHPQLQSAIRSDNDDNTEQQHKTEDYLAEAGIQELDILMRREDGLDRVTGDDLANVRSGQDNLGFPSVNFTLTASGSGRFGDLTYKNQPDPTTGAVQLLGIVLDGELMTAPSIRSMITTNGQITGKFSKAEVEDLVGILNAGSLSTAMEDQPASQNTIGSTLGAETVDKGMFAIGISLAAVLVFILIYYRFAGLVACLALLANLLFVMGIMMLFKAPLTLPGLAGLVLTVGMSVDANVLIFERIREELNRGSALRMAIRNGFAKATTTIVDANVTTLITGIVLYGIGTDQVKGFAVTLIFGILMSMYTAIYCSRVAFDIAERRRWITKLGMTTLVGHTAINFVGKRGVAAVVSVVLIAAGLAAVAKRGADIFDIDFRGGTQATMVLKTATEDKDVRAALEEAIAGRKEGDSAVQVSIYRISMVEYPENCVWQVVSSFGKVEDLKQVLDDTFELEKYVVDVGAVAMADADSTPAPSTDDSAETTDDDVSRRTDLPSDSIFAQADDAAAETATETATDAVAPTAETADDSEAADSTATEEPADDAAASADAADNSETEASDAETPAEQPADADATAGEVTSDKDFEDASETEAADDTAAPAAASVSWSKSSLTFNYPLNGKTLLHAIETESKAAFGDSISRTDIELTPASDDPSLVDWNIDSGRKLKEWNLEIALSEENTATLLGNLESSMESQAVWPSSSTVGSKVAGDMKQKAIIALVASLLGIVAYIWIRFQKVVFGLAAVVALVHDVLITLGAIAISFWLAPSLGFLLVDEFKISLPVLAAFLTIIGYSLNDTIVVFDRIREVRGKSPDITGEMINTSINQTLSRTLLTSFTTLLVVLILYFMGGQGIHGFAFALVIGVIVGTYSSVFVASPTLLWMSGGKQGESPSKAA